MHKASKIKGYRGWLIFGTVATCVVLLTLLTVILLDIPAFALVQWYRSRWHPAAHAAARKVTRRLWSEDVPGSVCVALLAEKWGNPHLAFIVPSAAASSEHNKAPVSLVSAPVDINGDTVIDVDSE
ncbi:hypothetical protein Pelo_5663 [Pelomyxa schiedti]|nr:hypothetical protein Pelo_5663 [Pelomyxa schiedti]